MGPRCSSAETQVCHRSYIIAARGHMSYLRCLCLFAYSGGQHILCCVFLRLVNPMLTVSLVCPFLIAPSVFSNVYLRTRMKIL